MKRKLLIVEDDSLLAASLREYALKIFDEIYLADSLNEALKKNIAFSPDIILMDNRLPDGVGVDFISKFKDINPRVEVIIMTAYGDVEVAIQAIKRGAFHYISKPFEVEILLNLLKRALTILEIKTTSANMAAPPILIGESIAIREIIRTVNLVKDIDVSVLICGETGTGKEVVARQIHFMGKRKKEPFIDVNCAAIPHELFESEMFGYEKGAFTGATGSKKGLLELVRGGTIFLDEIGDMPLFMQAKMLRVLDIGSFRRIGGRENIQYRGRVIAATNKNLKILIEKNKFREDLFYRLNLVTITIPPLRERKEDILPLAEHFIDMFSKKYKKEIIGISDDAKRILLEYKWPGNVRELRNLIERTIIFSKNRILTSFDILKAQQDVCLTLKKEKFYDEVNTSLKLEVIEKEHILKVLRMVRWNKSKAAKLLGISRPTLRRKIKEYGIPKDKDGI